MYQSLDAVLIVGALRYLPSPVQFFSEVADMETTGFDQFAVMYMNRNRTVEPLIDLPDPVQRALIAFDGLLSRIPLLCRFF